MSPRLLVPGAVRPVRDRVAQTARAREVAICCFTLLIVMTANSVLAIDSIPKNSGFSGFILAAPGSFGVENNLAVRASPPLLDDVGNPQIASIFESPSLRSVPSLLFAGELNYTFASTRTQVFLGNRIEDLLRLDVSFGFGLRQELSDGSILAGSILATPTEMKVWSDPYVEGMDRVKTYRDAPGARLRWGRILKTGLEATLTYRKYRHDQETSGSWLIDQGRLDSSQQSLLDRNGNIWNAQVSYRMKSGSHVFEPAIRYTDNDFDGSAMANKGPSIRLTYLYITPKLVLDANMLYHGYKGKEVHPIYGEVLDARRWGATLTAFYDLFKAKRLRAMLSVEYVREDANIDFFDSSVRSISVGVIWRYRRQ
ncbi:MAG: DUF2860 domain-containing protein [Actinomycetia bacterium]|nr:DUF2860 domain-containing protein [Actinomycetes bacterium]